MPARSSTHHESTSCAVAFFRSFRMTSTCEEGALPCPSRVTRSVGLLLGCESVAVATRVVLIPDGAGQDAASTSRRSARPSGSTARSFDDGRA